MTRITVAPKWVVWVLRICAVVSFVAGLGAHGLTQVDLRVVFWGVLIYAEVLDLRRQLGDGR